MLEVMLLPRSVSCHLSWGSSKHAGHGIFRSFGSSSPRTTFIAAPIPRLRLAPLSVLFRPGKRPDQWHSECHGLSKFEASDMLGGFLALTTIKTYDKTLQRGSSPLDGGDTPLRNTAWHQKNKGGTFNLL